jgi:flavorubredoxin
MRNIPLFESEHHKVVLLNETEAEEEEGIHSNQYLILHDGGAALLDPGGYGVIGRVLDEMLRYLRPEELNALILSHQDPDVAGGIATWLELTGATVYAPRIWTRFLPHYGVGHRSMRRFVGVPDEGMACDVAPGFRLELMPAHFLHSEGQINVYDPVSKILFTGDIGTAMLPANAINEPFVDDFSTHVQYVEAFHRRYMCSNRAARLWVRNVSKLDIVALAPQHGPIYRGAAVSEFLNWFRELECGIDIMTESGDFRRV